MNEEFKQLLSLVQITRAAQTTYFKARTQTNLQKAKALEKRLDDFVAKHHNTKEEPKQPNLF